MATAVATLSPLDELEQLLEEELAYARTHQIVRYFPADGPYRRELYAKHLEFFQAGSSAMLRLFLAANRVGKSFAGGVEDVSMRPDTIRIGGLDAGLAIPSKCGCAGRRMRKLKRRCKKYSWGQSAPGGQDFCRQTRLTPSTMRRAQLKTWWTQYGSPMLAAAVRG